MNATFVHESCGCFAAQRELDLAIFEAGKCILDFDNTRHPIEKEIEFYEFFDEPSDEYKLMLEEAEKSFLAKIGEKIMKIFDSFFNLMKNIGEKFASLFKKKEDDKKLSTVIANNPTLAKAFLENVQKGNVKYVDIKDLDEAIRVAEEILKDIDNDNVGADTVKSKVNGAISKLNDNLKPISGLIVTVGGIAGGITAIIGLRNACKKNHLEGAKLNNKLKVIRGEAEKKLENESSGVKATKFSWWCKLQSKICEEEGRSQNMFLKLLSNVADFTDKHTSVSKKVEYKHKTDSDAAKERLKVMNDTDKGTQIPSNKTENSTVVKNYYNFKSGSGRPRAAGNTPKKK